MTQAALIWLPTRMGKQVRGQDICLGKGFVALLAFKRLLTRVNAIVLFQIFLHRKATTTLTAFIWLLS